MESHFHIEGLPPFDGDHPIDLSYFTNAELHTIKRIAGVRAGEIDEAFEAGDNDLVIAFAIIALQRTGRKVDRDAEEVLWNADVGKISLVAGDEAEADAGPPGQAPPSESDEKRSGGEKTDSSGARSRADGDDPQETDRSSTGSPSSEPTLDSVPVTSPN